MRGSGCDVRVLLIGVHCSGGNAIGLLTDYIPLSVLFPSYLKASRYL